MKRKLSDIKFIHKKLNKQLQKKPKHPYFIEVILNDMIKQAKSSYLFLSFRELPKYSYLVFAVNQVRYILYMDAKLFGDTKNTALFQLNEDFSITPISRPSERINIKELEEDLKVKRTQINKREAEEAEDEAINLLNNILPNLIPKPKQSRN